MYPTPPDSCLACHSADYRFAEPGQEPTVPEADYGLDCVVCHGPMGSAHAGQLRLPPYELCAECHTTGTVVPGETPDQPQTEALHGVGGFELDGDPMVGPVTEHWWGIPDECSACHVHEEPSPGPGQPAESGHLFLANMRACEPCHSEEVATMLVSATGEEIDARLAEIAHYLDPGDPLYVDPESLTPEQLAQYEIAKFDYEFVTADRSRGSHNAGYARALLAEAEEFFGILPWPIRPPPDAPAGRDQVPPTDASRSEVHP
jgi:predicted CXXCH cytochrome family protein